MARLATVSEIYCYPVKSLAGIALPSAQVEARGLRYDRRWMVVDDDGRFLTQREMPRMACLVPSVDGTSLILNAPGMASLQIPLTLPPRHDEIDVRVWRSVCRAQLVGADADLWLSTYLGSPCRLVFMPETTRRTLNPEYTAGEGIVSFADGYPLLLLSEASLHDLNTHLDIPVAMNRFRPNIVVTGIDAYGEDHWKQVQIGAVVYHVVKPCDRCMMTTIDQQTGQRDGQEPLRTLSQHRLQDGKPLFGQYLVPETAGDIYVGDEVILISATR